MNVAAALAAATQQLAAAGVPSPEVDARWLLLHVTGWSPARLRTSAGEALAAPARAALAELLERRAGREPLQLLLGSVGFRHLEITVRPGVFIPRPETEVLAGEAIALVPAGGLVVEPCTGTGAVACAVAQESSAARVIATDMSANAVDLARHNAQQSGVEVEILLGDLLAPVPLQHQGAVDVLVSNPPYVADDEIDLVDPEVAHWDPREAWLSGPTGHEITDRLIAAAQQWLCPGGWLLLETASARAADTAQRAARGGLVEASVRRDLTGADRIVLARRP